MNTNEHLLKLDLQLFAEDEGANKSSDETEKPETKAQEETDSKQQEHMIPKSRFDEINTRYKQVQAQLDELTSAQKAAETKAQEEAGEFRQLYEELKTTHTVMETRNKELEGVIGELLTSKLAEIPKEFHDLIPDNLLTEAKLSWITKAEEKGLFGKKQQQPVGEQTNGNEYSGVTKEQFAKMAYADRTKLYVTNPELYRKLSR